MQDWEIEAMRRACANTTWQEIKEMRDRYAHYTRSKSDSAGARAKEAAELMQQILEEKLAEEDKQPTAAEWAAQEAAKEKPLTPAEARKKAQQDRERELRRLSRDGTVIPPSAPDSPYRTQQDFDLQRALNSPPPINYYACRNCTRFKRADDCTGECQINPHFFSARRQTYAEWLASEKKRG
jgi:hypothetical protein